MEFNLSTFILEIINFVILVWILKRFLYKPVLDVIDKRKQTIENTLIAAKEQHAQAIQLQAQYENRLIQWEQEKKQAWEVFHQELEKERQRLMKELYLKIEEERSKAKVLEEHRLLQQLRSIEERALKQGARFAALLLKRGASIELEHRLFAALLEDFVKLPEKQRQALRQSNNSRTIAVTISSVYKLQDHQRKKIQQLLDSIINHETVYHYKQDPELIAGFKIAIESWVLQANLQYELVGFSQIANVSPTS
jgi:F-type H+-transporting ATPase subunit b